MWTPVIRCRRHADQGLRRGVSEPGGEPRMRPVRREEKNLQKKLWHVANWGTIVNSEAGIKLSMTGKVPGKKYRGGLWSARNC